MARRRLSWEDLGAVYSREWGDQQLHLGHAKFEMSIRHPKGDAKERVGCIGPGLGASIRPGVVKE